MERTDKLMLSFFFQDWRANQRTALTVPVKFGIAHCLYLQFHIYFKVSRSTIVPGIHINM